MPYPNWTDIARGLTRPHPVWGRQLVLASACKSTPGNIFLEMASGTRDHPGSVYLGLSLDRAAAEHLLDCIAQHVPGYFEESAPLYPALEQPSC